MSRYHCCALAAICLASVTSFPLAAQENKQESAARSSAELRKALLGTWVLTGAPGNTNEPQRDAEMKFWGETHFAVTKRNSETGKVDYHHVGTYKLTGNEYAETVEFAIGATEAHQGKTYHFTIEVNGDTYIQRGVDNPWSQQWKRLTYSPDSEHEATDAPAEQAADDPLAVPENATTEELFQFMQKVVRTFPDPALGLSAREHSLKVFGAAKRAADIVIERNESGADVAKAVGNKLDYLRVLSRFDRSYQDELTRVSEQYANDARPEVAEKAIAVVLSAQASQMRTANADDAKAFGDRLVEYLERFGVNRLTFRAVASAASTMGYSEHTEIAANVHERIASFAEQSDDEVVREQAEKLVGAARRLRLPGNPMELFGVTADGSEFQWAEYRGKVVLVDFWASWCGPCMAELPNMKQNLERYGDQGFAIVGINMDNSRDAFQRCVETREITWVNLVSDDEGKQGWAAPMANHYGITGIPTAILVGRDGKVLSLRARGAELDRLLAEQFAEAEESGDSESDDSESGDPDSDDSEPADANANAEATAAE